MIKLKLLLENKSNYVGDCRTIIDNDILFSDATEMAQVIENSKQIPYEEFINSINFKNIPRLLMLNFRKHPNKFVFGKYGKLLWAHQVNNDIHYFFI